jgi:tetratricopeptide (TPR) repeat protein
MNRFRLTLLLAAALLACGAAFAQEPTREEFQARYERLVRNLGYDGVGIETVLDRWAAAYPDDPAVSTARFNYYLEKGRTTEMVPKPGVRRFMGQQPTLTLQDPEGGDVPYFEEDFYDEEYFGLAMRVLDQQIAEHPNELRWYALKVSALCAYEKTSPDMAAGVLKDLIARQASAKPAWTLDGEPVDEEIFQQFVGETCYEFFQAGSFTAYEYFREISERMNKMYPKNPAFLDNIGSYWQVARNNDKQAEKYYKKALKLDPSDYAATRNLQIIAKKKSQPKK